MGLHIRGGCVTMFDLRILQGRTKINCLVDVQFIWNSWVKLMNVKYRKSEWIFIYVCR